MKKFSIYRVFRQSFPDKNPDWREPFRHVANWTDEEVAFEFLRRNSTYWSFLNRFYQIPDDPAEWPAGRLEAYARVNFSKYDRLRKRAAEDFGLWRCSDPRLPIAGEQSPWTVAASISSRYQYVVQKGDYHDHMEYRFGIHAPADTITVDLRTDAPVEAQVEFVRWLLNRVRTSMGLDHRTIPRFQRTLFGDYLRTLDARDDGATFSTIVEHLRPGDSGVTIDRIRKRLKAAEATRDGGYRDLLLWSTKIKLPAFLQSIPNKLDELAAELWELAACGDSEGFDEVWTEFEEALKKPVRSRRGRWTPASRR
jgi:hypothetical protein